MSSFPQTVKSTLNGIISEMARFPWLFSKNPSADFSRDRKLDFENTLNFLISMEGKALDDELLDFFLHNSETTPTASALVQQRAKLLPEAFSFLFHQFSQAFPPTKLYKGFRLIASDGSDINFTRNPDDEDNYYAPGHSAKGFNMLHLNALYDLNSRTYVDALVQTGHGKDEFRAFADMVDRYPSALAPDTIFIADRGYSSYNVFAHLIEKGSYFLIRTKDKGHKGMVNGLPLPETEEFDITVHLNLIRKQSKAMRSIPGENRFIGKNIAFDYVKYGSEDIYPITLRIVRFALSDGSYECIVTNLPMEGFSPAEIKVLYYLRWGLETAFRELKYAVGMVNFHCKKAEFVIQEIWARLILYNFCEIITTHVVVTKKKTKHLYQLNYTRAIHICQNFLRKLPWEFQPNVEALISRYLLPVRNGRTFSRKVSFRHPVSFLYRIA